MELRVLGPIELRADGEARPLGGSKARLLLAVLAAHRGDVVPIERLAAALWGDDPPPSAVPTLQTHVSRLRRLVQGCADGIQLATRPPGYVLVAPDAAVDAGRFELLVGRARRRLDDDPAAARVELDEALAEWRGPAYAECSDLDLVVPEAVRLEELRVVAEELRVDARLRCGEHGAVVGEAEALVPRYPLRERLWALLMVALYRCGRPAEALRRAQDLRRLLADELGLQPSADVRALETAILSERPELDWAPAPGAPPPAPAPAERAPSGMPVDPTPLVGRGAEAELVRQLLRLNRMVTLTGTGGVGKTRLALHVAAAVAGEHRSGAQLVELAPVREAASAIAALAGTLDVQQRPGRSLEDSIVEVLAPLELLLVLDNCEHLLDAVSPLADRILRWCPSVRVLATSREPLGIAGETTFSVPPLAVPATADATLAEVHAAPAVQLFESRARAARPGFEIDAATRDAVVDICVRLDGVPLALELAAARVRSMTVGDLAARLGERFRLLTGARTADPRHRGLRDVVQWSYELLAPAEQDLFARLSVFAGAFPLVRAEDVCSGWGLARADVAHLLAALVDKSMVVAEDRDGTMRYRLLETLRDFARELLDVRPEAVSTTVAHVRTYLAVAEAAQAGLGGPEEARWCAEVDQDFGDLREAFWRTLAMGDLDLAMRLVAATREFAFRTIRYEQSTWADAAIAADGAAQHPLHPVVLGIVGYGRFVRGELGPAIEAGRAAFEAADRLRVPASALPERVLGNALFYVGDTAGAVAWIERMVTAAARSGDAALLAHACYMRSVAATSVGDPERPHEYAARAQAAAAESGSPTARSQAAYAAGLALAPADPAAALRLLDESARLAGSVQNRWMRAFALTEAMSLRAQQGELDAALDGYRDVIDTWFRGGDWANLWLSLRQLCGLLASADDPVLAATLHGAVAAAGAADALPLEPSGAAQLRTSVEALRATLGDERYDAALARGGALRDEEVVHLVLDHLEARRTAAS